LGHKRPLKCWIRQLQQVRQLVAREDLAAVRACPARTAWTPEVHHFVLAVIPGRFFCTSRIADSGASSYLWCMGIGAPLRSPKGNRAWQIAG
jgi:hypothetical protein